MSDDTPDDQSPAEQRLVQLLEMLTGHPPAPTLGLRAGSSVARERSAPSPRPCASSAASWRPWGKESACSSDSPARTRAMSASIVNRAGDELGGFLPRLAGALALLIVGLIVVFVVARLVRRGLMAAGLDDLAARWGVADVLERQVSGVAEPTRRGGRAPDAVHRRRLCRSDAAWASVSQRIPEPGHPLHAQRPCGVGARPRRHRARGACSRVGRAHVGTARSASSARAGRPGARDRGLRHHGCGPGHGPDRIPGRDSRDPSRRDRGRRCSRLRPRRPRDRILVERGAIRPRGVDRGPTIRVGDSRGTVERIEAATTVLRDERTIIRIPNRRLVEETVVIEDAGPAAP